MNTDNAHPRTAILSIVYYEPDWYETVKSIAGLQFPVPAYFVDRNGTGNLAKAINNGFIQNDLRRYEYLWILTNVRFSSRTLSWLESLLDANPKMAAVSPTFKSDHPHMCPDQDYKTVQVPFIEFTAACVRTSVYREHLLDDRMPYAGHDIDWGARVRESGWCIGVSHASIVDHTYIRHAPKHPITLQRLALRNAAEASTKTILHEKHGPEWPTKLQCRY